MRRNSFWSSSNLAATLRSPFIHIKSPPNEASISLKDNNNIFSNHLASHQIQPNHHFNVESNMRRRQVISLNKDFPGESTLRLQEMLSYLYVNVKTSLFQKTNTQRKSLTQDFKIFQIHLLAYVTTLLFQKTKTQRAYNRNQKQEFSRICTSRVLKFSFKRTKHTEIKQ